MSPILSECIDVPSTLLKFSKRITKVLFSNRNYCNVLFLSIIFKFYFVNQISYTKL